MQTIESLWSKERAVETLRSIRDLHINDRETTDIGIAARAIDALLPKLEKLEHICMIEYTHDLGPYHEQRAAVFDNRLVSEKEVKDSIMRGEAYHPCVVYMDMRQFESVFRSMGEEIPAVTEQATEAKTAPSETKSDEPPHSDSETMTIEELDLPLRAYNALKRAGYNTVGELLQHHRYTIQCVEGIGRKTAKIICDAVEGKGFEWH